MALEVGADLWHMKSYEPGSNTLMFNPGDGTSPLAAGAIPVSGSTMFVGPDGARYYNEVGENRHGRAKIAGEFRPVDHPDKTWFLWDQTRMDELAGMGIVDALPVLVGEQYIKADTLEELAEACGMDADVLMAQVADWGFFAEQGRDYQFGRDAATIRAFDGGPYYAMPGIPLILNTQGGPRRNKDAQVMGADGEPIPHLYSAGELGSMNASSIKAAATCPSASSLAASPARMLQRRSSNRPGPRRRIAHPCGHARMARGPAFVPPPENLAYHGCMRCLRPAGSGAPSSCGGERGRHGPWLRLRAGTRNPA